jgi:hypothetical protein
LRRVLDRVLQRTRPSRAGEAARVRFVVTGSGTGELRGLRGDGGFEAALGQHATIMLDHDFEPDDRPVSTRRVSIDEARSRLRANYREADRPRGQFAPPGVSFLQWGERGIRPAGPAGRGTTPSRRR